MANLTPKGSRTRDRRRGMVVAQDKDVSKLKLDLSPSSHAMGQSAHLTGYEQRQNRDHLLSITDKIAKVNSFMLPV